MKPTKKRKRKLGVVGTAVLMAVPLALIFYLFSDDVLNVRNICFHVLSGRLFTRQWDPIHPVHAGYYLDQPTIGKYYFHFTWMTVIVLPYLAIVRKRCARRTRLEYWTFVIPTVILCLLLICIVTVPFCWSIKWMDAAGRGPGDMVVGLGGYIVVLGFFFWAIRPPKGKEESENLSAPDTQSGAQL